ncbi:MAG: hypothetical protein Q4C68_01875 [Moraxella sp.]|nr:hypothetical protein [Moraxella sp.]
MAGKKQSCIGDDIWCPACQSMGKIIPDQDRLSTKINGRMPALHDDLCLCKCSPPPKLVHSQTTFKEIIDSNTLARYQQTQSSLQNNLTDTKDSDDTLPNFTVHFRRPDDYQGEYGFDWLRDEYLYGTDKSRKVYFGRMKDLITEYRGYQRKELTNLLQIVQYGRPNEYTPAWLNLFSPSNQSKTGLSSVKLHLYFEQSDQDTPLIDDKTLLLFKCSNGLMVDKPTLAMGDALSNMTKENVNLIMEQSAYQQGKTVYTSEDVPTSTTKTIIYYKSNHPMITVTCTSALSQLGTIEVFAKKNGIEKPVGLLCVYPNAKRRQATIQPIELVANPISSTNGFPQEYPDAIQNKLFNQVGMTAEVKESIGINLINKNIFHKDKDGKDTITTISSHQQQQVIDDFAKKYQHAVNDAKNINLIPLNEKTSKEAFDDAIELLKALNINQYETGNHENVTYLILTNYVVAENDKLTLGMADRKEPNENEKHQCRTTRNCNYWSNYVVIYRNTDSSNNETRTILHELGHSFGLEHPFQDYISNLLFEELHTDNLMDYNSGITLNKYQWDIISNDDNITTK